MDKQHILSEIRRTADENGGVGLGEQAFRRETGIRKSDWYGKYWARWGDALAEVGISGKGWTDSLSDELLLQKLVELILSLNKFPTHGEIRMRSTADPTFPSHSTFAKLGSKPKMAERIIAFLETQGMHPEIIDLCRPIATATLRASESASETEEQIGFVYMLKSGRYYKIGRSNAAGRRERELAIQLPDKAEPCM